MGFLKKVLDMISTNDEAPKKMTEEEILKAIDDLAEEENKKMSFTEEHKEEDYEVLTRIPAPKLWSTYKYLSNMGTDEFGISKLFFVIPVSVDTEVGNQSVNYLYFPLNGTHLDIAERSVKIEA